MLSTAERRFISEGCRDDCRGDGRARDQVRGYAVTVGEVPLSHGSASIRVGSALHILCSVKADVVAPSQAGPGSGVVEEVHVTFMGSDGSGGGGRSRGAKSADRMLGASLTRLLCDHILIDDSAAALCILPGHLVWRLFVDIVIVYGADTAGSLLDWCSIVMVAALCDTRLPVVDVVMNDANDVEGGGGAMVDKLAGNDKPSWQVQSDMALAMPIPGMDRAPTIVTITLIQSGASSYLLLDATAAEAACAAAQVHVAVSSGTNASEDDAVICAIDMSGGASLPFRFLPDVTALALGEAQDQQQRLHSAIEAVSVKDSQHKQPHMLQERFVIE